MTDNLKSHSKNVTIDSKENLNHKILPNRTINLKSDEGNPEENENLLEHSNRDDSNKNIYIDTNAKKDNSAFNIEATDQSTDKEPPPNEKKGGDSPLLSPQLQVYISHFLSSWGDRMWMFAGGLFLIEITPGSLRLVAIYEAANSLTVIILGAAIGRWVDRTSRLKTAQLSLVVQNVMVCLCTLLLCLLTSYRDFFAFSENNWHEYIMQTAVVVVSCIAQIGSLGSKLAIEKDWIVIISEESDVRLSTMNSVLRTVDLSTEMLAPVLVGFVMSSAGMVAGGIVIASWNVVSLVIEYGLLHNLYRRVTSLQRPKENNTGADVDGNKVPFLISLRDKVKDASATWKLYLNHDIRYAGLGLSFLYMTVLALDNYSRAYVYESGVSKAVLGILTACASVFGILGSLAFPFLRQKIGVLKTGIFGFTIESICLIFCVVSVFTPGTLFRPYSLIDSFSANQNLNTTTHLNTTIGLNLKNTLNVSSVIDLSAGNVSNPTLQDCQLQDPDDETPFSFTNNSADLDMSVGNHSDLCRQLSSPSLNSSNQTDYTSASLLLTGIITSRFGLWLADLTVTQILQEEVAEAQRGGINGVQSSLNQSFSLFRSVALIIFSTMETFGYLIILSFAFVVTASIFFYVYAYQTRRKAVL